jgi:hypothetical protein
MDNPVLSTCSKCVALDTDYQIALAQQSKEVIGTSGHTSSTAAVNLMKKKKQAHFEKHKEGLGLKP